MLEFLTPVNDSIQQFDLSHEFYFMLSHQGRVFSFGKNVCGVLGLRDLESRQIPTLVEFPDLDHTNDKIVDFKCGEKHVLFLSQQGRVFSCGSNEFGQLGSRHKKELNVPEEILSTYFDSPIRKIFVGPYQSFFISEKETIYACGKNDLDELFCDDPRMNIYGKSIFRLTEPTSISRRVKQQSKGLPVKSIFGADVNTGFLFGDGTLFITHSSNYMYEFDQNKPTPEPCYAIIPVHNSYHNVKKVVFSKYNIIFILEDGDCLVCGGAEMLGTADRVRDFERISLGNNERIEDAICGHFHVILKSSQRKLYSFGCNTFGELGLGNTSTRESFRELKPMLLPFTWEENDQVHVFAGRNCTFIMLEKPKDVVEIQIAKRVVMLQQQYLPETTNNYHQMGNISSIHVSLPLVKSISPDLHALLTNHEFIENLKEREMRMLKHLVQFICCELALVLPDTLSKDQNAEDDGLDPYTSYLFSIFDRFLTTIRVHSQKEDISCDLAACVFLLNDISDIGVHFKAFIFNELFNNVSTENSLPILEQFNTYLTIKVLKKSKNSLVLLAVQKCLSYMKNNYPEIEKLYSHRENFSVIKPKISDAKTDFFKIQVNWSEHEIEKDLVSCLNTLFNESLTSDISVIIDENNKEELVLHKHVLATNSPVLAALFRDHDDTSQSSLINLYDFSLMMQDEWTEMFFNACPKSRCEILRILLEMCYSKFDSGLDLSTLICVLLIAHQFQMEFIVKHLCAMLINRIPSLKNSPLDLPSLFHLASLLEVDINCRDFTDRFIIQCAREMKQSELIELIKRYDDKFVPSFVQRLRVLQDLTNKNQMLK
ncbi:hypothetical protein C9374_012108 [Naegleria lovaniensis]|uniref:BTB domain-containing protein n=1 Tax=Naegleria lovaniensis TaxID=51637 RepID=A0AA88GGA0_NAELO|nr:uncharacterized protein C9374_012108 [Naegleria lovaniensis]KAG2373501.1 hypothetical protein C9374_012108 [Naegleria lovaniensis]